MWCLFLAFLLGFLKLTQPQLLTFNEQKSIANCRVKREVDVPVSVAYACYSDREAISEWMPFISTVKVCLLSF
jgi:uncharacterized membrane protein